MHSFLCVYAQSTVRVTRYFPRSANRPPLNPVDFMELSSLACTWHRHCIIFFVKEPPLLIQQPHTSLNEARYVLFQRRPAALSGRRLSKALIYLRSVIIHLRTLVPTVGAALYACPSLSSRKTPLEMCVESPALSSVISTGLSREPRSVTTTLHRRINSTQGET